MHYGLIQIDFMARSIIHYSGKANKAREMNMLLYWDGLPPGGLRAYSSKNSFVGYVRIIYVTDGFGIQSNQ